MMSELEKEIKERITSYAWDVVEGKILACQNIILACKRFIAFLQRDDMYFDIEEVEKTIRFFWKVQTLYRTVQPPFLHLARVAEIHVMWHLRIQVEER